MLTRLARAACRTPCAGAKAARRPMLRGRGAAAVSGMMGAVRTDSAVGMATRLGLAVCDQALFAGTSFAFTLLLARWATQNDFGAFSVAFSVFVLLQNVFEGLVYEPFGVYGAGRLAQYFDAYVGRLLVGHIFIGGTLAGTAIVIGVALGLAGQPTLSGAFLGMGIATPFLLLRILTRQSLYVTTRVHWSVLVGVAYLVCSVTTLALLRHGGLLTPFSAFLALGTGSLVASAIVVLAFLAPVWRSSHPELAPRRLMADHFRYGGWAIGERLLLWLQSNAFFLELPLVAGLHAGAAYRALSTLTLPANLTIAAMATALLPALVRSYTAPQPSPWARWLFPGAIGAGALYWILLVGFGRQAAHLAFAGQYDADLNLPLVAASGLAPFFVAVTTVLELRLRSRMLIRQVLIARMAATAVLLLVGIALVARFQIMGAALALGLVWAVTAAVHVWLNWRRAGNASGLDRVAP